MYLRTATDSFFDGFARSTGVLAGIGTCMIPLLIYYAFYGVPDFARKLCTTYGPQSGALTLSAPPTYTLPNYPYEGEKSGTVILSPPTYRLLQDVPPSGAH